MKIWENVKKLCRSWLRERRIKRYRFVFPIYCRVHGVKTPEYQGAIAQSRADDKLQLVHVPQAGYPFNVFVYSVPLNRILGYLDGGFAKRLVKTFGRGMCLDGVIENVTGGAPQYKYRGCNIRVYDTLSMMREVEDFSHLYGA